MIMLEKTAELIAKVANMDELNTIIVVTHDVTSACSVADHIWLMGRESDAQGNKIPGSRIIKEFNLIDRNLCWHPGITTRPEFVEFVREVKEEFRNL